VYGVDGLRVAPVAHASVFPVVPHGNTHAPTVMVGEGGRPYPWNWRRRLNR